MKLRSLIAILISSLALVACSNSEGLKESLGLNREGPDEFRVLPRPPLNVPPDFNLRPPGKESEYVSGMPAQAHAHDEILGTASPSSALAPTAVAPVTSGDLPSSSDAQLLSNAGANKADPQIRQKITDDRMNGIGPKESQYLISTKSSADPQVDATKEAQRLKQDKDQNQPATSGDTPMVTPQDKGILGNIF